ncbi:MAG: drug/metabolite transporter (DMT)-like permease [Parasphingorhabdus sp.]
MLALILMRSNLKQIIISRRPGLQIWRSILMLLTNGLFFTAVRTVELTTATTIMFLTPIVVTILAIPILGERVGKRRWAGGIIGIIGAIIIVRPGIIDIDPAILILVVTTITHAFYQLLTRQVRNYDDPITSLMYTGLLDTVVMSMLIPWYWVVPVIEHWPFFVLMGLLGSVAYFCLIQALRAAPVSVVSPFSYTTLVWATAYSYFLFNELPDY